MSLANPARGATAALGPVDPSLGAGVLTADGTDTYALTVAAGGRVDATAAATNTGGNLRQVFWQRSSALSVKQTTCATWVDNETNSQQPGAALRITENPNGGARAITVTKNIWANYYWTFNVHVMDSSAAQPITGLGGFQLDQAFFDPDEPNGKVKPYPWRMCARAIGNEVSFKVWPLTDPEPEWGDPIYGGAVQLPAGWDGAGRAGWYIGHLGNGESAGFTNLSVK